MTEFNYEQTVSQLRAASALQQQMADALVLAWQAGYEEGSAGRKVAELNDEAQGLAYEDGYQEGYQEGYEDGSNVNEAFNDGYLEGVHDARVAPSLADDVIEQIIADDAEAAAFEAFDELPKVHQFVEGEDHSHLCYDEDGDAYDFGRSVLDHARAQAQ
jgi:flagellar biosynthesis/type III secretory pathway protein FliH